MQGLQRRPPQEPQGPAPYGSALRNRGSPGMPHGSLPNLAHWVLPFLLRGSLRDGLFPREVDLLSWGQGTSSSLGGLGGAITSLPPGPVIVYRWLGEAPEGPGLLRTLLLETSGSLAGRAPATSPCAAPPAGPPTLVPGAVGSSGWK